MSASVLPSVNGKTVWDAYRDNFSRHILGVSRHMQTEMMRTLQQDCGHQNLRLAFAPYITLIGHRGRRPSDLAGILGISRQACNQAANQLEAAGYIARTPDPDDGRATLLLLTDSGKKLRKDGLLVVSDLDREFARLTAPAVMEDARNTLQVIQNHLAPGRVREEQSGLATGSLGALLPRLSDYIVLRLMVLTREKGHPDLQLSFGQVLTLIGQPGGKIQQIAKIQDVSKQAISATASELENLGYLRRDVDPTDTRQVLLKFTDLGTQLMADSIASVNQLEAEFSAMTSKAAISRLKDTFRRLYTALQIEQGVFGNGDVHDIEKLAQQLHQQLGAEGSRALAQHLLNPEINAG